MTDIFIDMDGVVADWELGIARRYNRTVAEIHNAAWGPNLYALTGTTASEFWSSITYDIIRGLHPINVRFANMPSPKQLYNAMADIAKATGGVCAFLTSAPMSHAADILKAKQEWLNHYIGREVRDAIYCPSEHKRLLAKPGRILLDDYGKNCQEWVRDGGAAIVYDAYVLNDWPNPLAQLISAVESGEPMTAFAPTNHD